jgi:acetyl esterase/lipase
MKTLITTILLCASFLYAADNKRNNMTIQKDQKCKSITVKMNDYKTLEDGSKLTLKTYYPANYQPKDQVYPTIVFYFGGGWYGGNYDHFKSYAKYFVEKGFIIYTVEYRTKKSHGTSPRIALEDARSAMRWVKTHAKEQGVDLKNLYAGGGSAGACLAAATAFESSINDKNDDLAISTMPTGLLLFNPVYDNGPGGYGYDRVKDYWEEFSPMNNLSSNTPPTLVLFGDQDQLVPLATSQKYKSILDEFGVYNELHLYEGRSHGFFNAGKPDHKDTIIKAEAFINKTIK